jgi:hypothetical protein
LVAALAALSTAGASAFSSAPGGWFVAAGLALVPALLIAGVLWVPLRRIGTRIRRAQISGRWAVGLVLFRDLGAIGLFEVCDRVADAPDGPHAVLGHGLVLLAAAGLAARVVSALPALSGVRVTLPVWLALFTLSGAVEIAIADAITLPREHLVLHELVFAAALTGSIAGWLWLLQARPSWRRPAAVACLVGFAACALAFLRAPAPWPAIMATHSPHQRLISLARKVLDRDGDGFSAVLGGGDCDDDDPAAFPLSTIGRDCLGWMGAAPPATRAPELHAELARPVDPPGPPSTVVLVTIDAFRCGFGVREPAPLRDACPSLTHLAHEGRARLDAHANFPVTARSITALHTGDLYANPARPVPRPSQLGPFYAAHGFSTVAVVTHPYELADPSMHHAFQTLDESLAPAATRRSGVTAERVTDRVLEHLAEAHGPTFVWAHYFDPHAPYVRNDGDLFTDDDVATYALEVRRTDAAIARLAAALARRPDAARTILFVTADHGEAFGEHGIGHHGHDLHDEVMRVPMIAWTAGGAHDALGDAHMPTSTIDVAGWLERLVDGAAAPLPPIGPVFARIPAEGDGQLAVIADGQKLIYHRALNFLELYDLVHDPDERHDLAALEPAAVMQLGRTLAPFVRSLAERKQRDLRLLEVAHAQAPPAVRGR